MKTLKIIALVLVIAIMAFVLALCAGSYFKGQEKSRNILSPEPKGQAFSP